MCTPRGPEARPHNSQPPGVRLLKRDLVKVVEERVARLSDSGMLCYVAQNQVRTVHSRAWWLLNPLWRRRGSGNIRRRWVSPRPTHDELFMRLPLGKIESKKKRKKKSLNHR